MSLSLSVAVVSVLVFKLWKREVSDVPAEASWEFVAVHFNLRHIFLFISLFYTGCDIRRAIYGMFAYVC